MTMMKAKTAHALLLLVIPQSLFCLLVVGGRRLGTPAVDRPPPEPRVVGGNVVAVDSTQFPWYAVPVGGSSLCGASLIHPQALLSVAHCARTFRPGKLVQLGTKIWQGSSALGVTRKITSQAIHPEYNTTELIFDFMLLFLDKPVYAIKPLKLADPVTLPALSGRSATVMGFGSHESSNAENNTTRSSSNQLREMHTYLVDDGACRRTWRYVHKIQSESQLCAWRANVSACQGDSGSPLVMWENHEYVHVGLVSFGVGCGHNKFPGVYARTTAARPWLEHTVCSVLEDCYSLRSLRSVSLTVWYRSNSTDDQQGPLWSISLNQNTVATGPNYVARLEQRWTSTYEMPVGNYSLIISPSCQKGGCWFRVRSSGETLLITRDHRTTDALPVHTFPVGEHLRSFEATNQTVHSTQVYLTIQYDSYPMDISWRLCIADGGDEKIMLRGPQYVPAKFESWTTKLSVVVGFTYHLDIYDSYGDGLVTADFVGFIAVHTDGGELLQEKSGRFGTIARLTFDAF